MAERSPLIFGCAVAAAGASLMLYKLHADEKRYISTLPPSPKSYPFIGNLLSIPQGFEHIAYIRLGEQLRSKIFSLTAFGTTVVVLNDKEDAINLLDKRSSMYSDRCLPPMVTEPSLLDWGSFGSLIGYGDRWRKYRRLMNPWLNKQASTIFHRSQQDEARRLMKSLLSKHKELESSHELEAKLYFTMASTLLHSIYGYEVKSEDDIYISRIQATLAFLTKALIPSNFLVNTIPALMHVPNWFPGAGWKQVAKGWRQEKEDLVESIYKHAIDHMEKGDNQQTIVASLKNQALRLGLSDKDADDHVQQVAMTLFAGGTETTGNTSLMFLMAMILFPEVQKKAQQELDALLGDSRLPNLDDRDKLQYVGRVIQETLRWGPVLPIAIPHACFQDNEYKGYHIPKGAIVIGNVWAMNRDPEIYRNPDTFEPDRFLDPSVPHPATFGWGRRRCPGIHFGEASLFCIFATFLTVFNIAAPQDEFGNEVMPTLSIANDFILRPEEFKFRLTSRSSRREELLMNAL